MENSDKKVQMKVYIRPGLLKDLKYLHEKEGPINPKTKKRKPFSTFISDILASHAHERITCIRGLENIEDMEDDLDF